MRRLPVYFLLDVSDSMAGEPLEAVSDGMKAIVADLRNDPYALETMYLAVIVFAGRAELSTPLTELALFEAPTLPLGAGTSLGAALDLLMRQLDADVQPTTENRKGDWKPLVFLFTDGIPTDDATMAVSRWRSQYQRRANMVAVTFGANADMNLLRQLTENVLTLGETSVAAYREFFKWVSASLQVSSMAVNDYRGEDMRLASHCINLDKAPPVGTLDGDWAVLRLKCTTGQFWLAKYAQVGERWVYDCAVVADEEAYNRLSGSGAGAPIETAQLDILPDCPVCASNTGLLHCKVCGGLSCLRNSGMTHCPWCGEPIGKVRTVNNMQTSRSRG